MVRHEGPREGAAAAAVRLAADPAAVRLGGPVELPPAADHAVFAFMALERGEHAIRASVGGEFAEGSVTALPPGPSGRGLVVTLPPSTRTPHVAGAVHLVEWRGGGSHAAAVPAEADLAVSLSSGGGGVLVPGSAVIPAGSTGATFDAFVAAPGEVRARGGGMLAGAHIGFERDEPAPVRVRV